jgi:hypothetical protein
MLVKVKTPELPLHLAGETQRQDLNWQPLSRRAWWPAALIMTVSYAPLWLVKIG